MQYNTAKTNRSYVNVKKLTAAAPTITTNNTATDTTLLSTIS